MSVSTATLRRPTKRRRTYLKAGDRRAQILDVAKSVFAKRGYHVANIADICKAARIGRGTLYQYFDNKRDVLLELVSQISARIRHVLDTRPKIEAIPDPEKATQKMIVAFTERRLREMLDAVFVDEATLRLLLRDARGLDVAVDQILQHVDSLLLATIEADTRAAQRAGVVRSAIDPAIAARYVLGGIEKIVLSLLSSGAPIDVDALVKSVVDIELFGILREERKR